LSLLGWLRSKSGDADAHSASSASAALSAPPPEPQETTQHINGLSSPDSTADAYTCSESTVARCRRWVPVDQQADQLLSFLINAGMACREIHHKHLRALYLALCEEMNWSPHGWQFVASAFKKITTGTKVYRLLMLDDGTRRKVRVYPVVVNPASAQMPGQLTSHQLARSAA
jgi:hypothetical protein